MFIISVMCVRILVGYVQLCTEVLFCSLMLSVSQLP